MTRPQDLTTAEAADWLHQPDAPRIIDVRTPAEFGSSHLSGAVNVPLDLVEQHATEIGDALDGDVLLVCRTDGRAHKAADLLAPVIGPRAHVLTGGMTRWEQDQRPVEEPGNGTWAMERQVRTVAGGLALASILASLRAPKSRFVAGGIGAGLLWSGLSDTCAMARVLEHLPWNKRQDSPTVASVTGELRHAAVGN